MIEKIVVEGVEHTDPSTIKKAIVDHFKRHYAKKDAIGFDISSLGLSVLSVDQSQNLIAEVNKEEIKEALLSC